MKREAVDGAVDGAVDMPTPDAAAPPPTQDELREWLATQVRELRADAARYRAQGDTAALERTSRQLVTAQGLLVRATPPDAPTREEVTSARMAEHAARAKDLIRRWVEILTSTDPDIIRAREALTRCPYETAREEYALLHAQIVRRGTPATEQERGALDLLADIGRHRCAETTTPKEKDA